MGGLSKKLESSIKIKGEYEALIAKLFEDIDTQQKIKTALEELDRARRPNTMIMDLSKDKDETGPKKTKTRSLSKSHEPLQRKKAYQKFSPA